MFLFMALASWSVHDFWLKFQWYVEGWKDSILAPYLKFVFHFLKSNNFLKSETKEIITQMKAWTLAQG